jgi:hypothetical protein
MYESLFKQLRYSYVTLNSRLRAQCLLVNPSWFPERSARRMIRLRTYPRPTLLMIQVSRHISMLPKGDITVLKGCQKNATPLKCLPWYDSVCDQETHST